MHPGSLQQIRNQLSPRRPSEEDERFKPWRQFPPHLYAQNRHERSPVCTKGSHRIRTQARASSKTLPLQRRSFGQSQGGGHKRRTFDNLISRVFRWLLLTDGRDSPIALGSKVGYPLPPYLVSLVEISLEK